MKEVFEYKADFFASFITVLFWDISFIIAGLVAANEYLGLIDWTFTDYIIFLLFTYIVHNIQSLMLNDKELGWMIIKGELNDYCRIPGNRFLNYFFNILFNNLVIMIGNLLIFVPFILYDNTISLTYVPIAVILTFLIAISMLMLQHCVQSFCFYSNKIFDHFSKIYGYSEYSLQTYTPLFLRKSPIGTLMFIFHSFYVATLIVPLFRGVIAEEMFFYVMIIFGSLIVTTIITLINWHFGLKRYEAFG